MTTCRSDQVVLIVDTEPQGKARPRFDSRSHRTYTPTKTIKYEWTIREEWRRRYPDRPPLLGDVSVEIIARFKMPSSWSKKKKMQTILTPCRKRPDTDNIAKAVLDALNGTAYDDDAQVVQLKVSKVWGLIGSVEIRISEVRRE